MTDMPNTVFHSSDAARRTGWAVFLAAAATAFSFVFSCATPFAALAAIAALNMRRLDAMLTILLAFAINQAVGFGFLGYPHDTSTIAWGAGIGASALIGLAAAFATARFALGAGYVLSLALSFLAAFAAYQLGLQGAGLLIGTGGHGLSAEVVRWVLQMNALALAVLAGFQFAGRRLGLSAPLPVRAG
ncbi:hypothetical protein [Parvibaculum sp.]|uniref:hypothetical protein n=1 Tax=Parvibaculum sp. TaxID=2024848 RepID=UPI0025CC75B6|nr:hypothetical protein [Parvibaculum sp.]